MAASHDSSKPQMSVAKAWIPYVLIVIFILGSSKLVPPINQALGGIKSTVTIYAGENPGALSFAWINTPGVWMFIAGIIGGLIQGASIGDMALNLLQRLRNTGKP